MTKLLADIAAATPVDIVATDVHLTAGQGLSAQGSVTIQGTAKSRELVNEFQENLTKTRLFRDVKQPRSESTSEGLVEFTITADIPRGQGHVKVDKPADNFGKTKGKPLVVRMYGEEGAKLIAAGGSAPAGGDDAKKGSRRGDRGDGKDDPAESRKPSSTDTLPPVVTDEDIKKMDKTTATKEWIARKVYVQKTPTLDSSIKQRLQDEEAKIKAHGASLPSASAGGGGGGSGGDKPK